MSLYRFIDVEKAHYPVAMMCRVLRVSRSGYYDWRLRRAAAAVDPMGGLSPAQVRRAAMTAAIVSFHEASGGTYGAPRITADLTEAGWRVSRKTVAKRMRDNQLRGCQPRRWRRTTLADPAWTGRRRDLVKGVFEAHRPDRKWYSDITYIRTWEGWSYLATVIDGCTRQVVGWAIADHMRADLVLAAVDMAVRRRNPAPGLILHADRGGQYTSAVLAGYAAARGIRLSVGATGVCWDNALAESFFGVLKNELIHRRPWPTRTRLRAAVVTWIEGFYNARRRHSALGMISPDTYAQRLQYRAAA